MIEDRKPTWRHDWAWFIAYAAIILGFMVWSAFWRLALPLPEVIAVVLFVAILNIIRGVYIGRSRRQ